MIHPPGRDEDGGTDVGREDGAALVEFALVVTLLLTLVIGTITYGLILGLHQSVTHAASAAARSAVVVPGEDAAVVSRAETVATEQLSWLGSKADVLTVEVPTPTPCPGVPSARCVTVTVRYPYQEHPLIPSFLGLPVPEQIASTATLELEDVA